MKPSLTCIALSLIVLSFGCTPMSEIEVDNEAGMNGGFEIVSSGLPVNWLMYTPNTVPNSDFSISLDTKRYKEGNQSLNFNVIKCDSTTGWKAPGFGQEFELENGKKYKISLWILNIGSEFNIRIGGVSAKEGESETIIHTDIDYPEWSYLEYNYTIPVKYNRLRFECNIMKPGSFWIDDISIVELD